MGSYKLSMSYERYRMMREKWRWWMESIVKREVQTTVEGRGWRVEVWEG